jgi:hypothetical protein
MFFCVCWVVERRFHFARKRALGRRTATQEVRVAFHAARHVFQRVLDSKKIRTLRDITTSPLLIELNYFYSSDNYRL